MEPWTARALAMLSTSQRSKLRIYERTVNETKPGYYTPAYLICRNFHLSRSKTQNLSENLTDHVDRMLNAWKWKREQAHLAHHQPPTGNPDKCQCSVGIEALYEWEDFYLEKIALDANVNTA